MKFLTCSSQQTRISLKENAIQRIINTEQKVLMQNVSVSTGRPHSVAPSRCKNITSDEVVVEKQALCLPWLILFSLASIKTGGLMHTYINS